MIYLCHMLLLVPAMNVYFFDRDLESRELRFSHNDTQDVCSDKNDTICLHPSSFSSVPSLLPSYQVLEYRDYLNHREFILYIVQNSNFIVTDSKSQINYLVYNGEIKPLAQASDVLENIHLSVLYFTDVFFHVANANLYAMIAAAVAIIASTFSMFSILVLMVGHMFKAINKDFQCSCDRLWTLLNGWYLPWSFWMLSSTVFLGTILSRLVVIKSKMDESNITLISTMADWGSTGFIIWTMRVILVMNRPPIEEEDVDMNEKDLWNQMEDVYMNDKDLLNQMFVRLIPYYLSLALVLSLSPRIIYLLNSNILGLDDASLQTGYSYLNTVTGSIDGIRFM
jgi:hypothetical protein